MKHQAIRRAAVMLSVLLVSVVRTQAATITLADVTHAFANGQQRSGVELRLRSVAQSGAVPLSGVLDLRLTQSGHNQSSNTQTGTQSGTTTTTTTGSGSIVDAAQQQQQQGGTVETVDLGDVTGTVCDCGEIPIPPVEGGGFPLWPLLGLAGIPLFFIPDGEPPFEPPPPPPPPPPAIPEPATILLLGTSLMALGAGARRRSRSKALATVATPAEEV
ncbi:MAG TPA: PEP-CTERM sorting domain-containing protein [Pyrinomonadaceae bacterium]|nr:PEP-CTERM sorting domain-containing protein [Pyrinomonadaceae bacterium]